MLIGTDLGGRSIKPCCSKVCASDRARRARREGLEKKLQQKKRVPFLLGVLY